MELFYFFSGLITLAALFSYVNAKYINKPDGIIMMLFGSLLSVVVVLTTSLVPKLNEIVVYELSLINFSEFVLGMLLSFLLFAGAMNTDWKALKKSSISIISFATLGVIISSFLIAIFVFFILMLFGIEIPLIYCFLFGALISPTDPIAVLSILNKAGISESVKIKITGESLFNDGIGVVLFLAIMQVVNEGMDNLSYINISIMFIQEAVGGLAMGFVIGYLGYILMKSIDNFQSEILITLSMVMAGYSICHLLHLSGPLAMVVAGLFTGNKSKFDAWSKETYEYVEKFWEVIDEILNAILFILIGLELIIINFNINIIYVGLIMAILILLTRYLSLWLPANLFRFNKNLESKTLEIMTLGGLRGGISIALALSLPAGEMKELIVSMTYVIVLFSIIIQGFSITKYLDFVKKNS